MVFETSEFEILRLTVTESIIKTTVTTTLRRLRRAATGTTAHIRRTIECGWYVVPDLHAKLVRQLASFE